jgi:hypothetical protein
MENPDFFAMKNSPISGFLAHENGTERTFVNWDPKNGIPKKIHFFCRDPVKYEKNP